MKPLVFVLLLFLNSTDGRDKFHVCIAGNLKVTESFEASRLAAAMFPCIVSDVFLKYKPPTKMVLVAYRPICFVIRTCFAMTSANRITSREDFNAMTECFIDVWVTLTAMDIFRYYGLPEEILTEFANEKFLRSFLSRVFDCYGAVGIENYRTVPDSGIAILRWIMEKLF